MSAQIPAVDDATTTDDIATRNSLADLGARTASASEIIRRCLEQSDGNRLAAVELAYAYTQDQHGWPVTLAVLAAIDRHYGPEEQITDRLLVKGERATFIQSNWKGELHPTRVRRFEVNETRPYFYESDNGACRWPGILMLSYLEPHKRKRWWNTHYFHFGDFFLIERHGKTLFDSREYPLFKELASLRARREAKEAKPEVRS
jgi:hypothetical protein